MKKDKLIFFGIVGGVFVLLIIYIFFAFSGKKGNTSLETDFKAPEIEQKKQSYKSRIDALTEGKYNKDEDKDLNPLRYDFLKDNKEDTLDQQKQQQENATDENEQKKAPSKMSNTNNSIKHKPSHNSSRERIKPQSERPISAEPGSQSSGGFGIYTSNKKRTETTSSKDVAGKYFKAYLEETTRITDGKSLVFILSEEAYIDGRTFNKNSLLFAKAYARTGYFDLVIENIRGTDGMTYSPTSLYAFNEYYSRGISHEGNINQAVKDGTSETVFDETSNITGTRIERGTDIALKALDNTVKSLKKGQVASVDLYEGYVVYIKKIDK